MIVAATSPLKFEFDARPRPKQWFEQPVKETEEDGVQIREGISGIWFAVVAGGAVAFASAVALAWLVTQ